VEPLLAGAEFESDEDLYLFLVLQIACVFCLLSHGFFLIYYLTVRLWPFIILNVCGVLLHCFCYKIVRRKAYLPAGLLITADVMLCTIFSVVLTGTGNYVFFYFFLVIIMQMIIPYGQRLIQNGIVVLLWLTLTFLVWLSPWIVPIYDVGEPNRVLAMMNVQLGFIGAIVELSIGMFLRKVIADYRKRRIDDLEDQANHDPLTKLYNRRYADKVFAGIRNGDLGRIWCVAMLDIDDFKKINDTYGHSIGDDVLVNLSLLLLSQLRKTDLLFRWGGEEFLILLKDVELDAAFRVLEKIRLHVAETVFPAGDYHIRFTVTVGVAPLKLDQVEDAIALCDQKLYEGKAATKNVVVK
jgi:diguanylate cyclase (GGDEF)-like protein